MKDDYIDNLYSAAFHGDSIARNKLIALAGVNPSTDEDVFIALSILSGRDTLAAIKKFAKKNNIEAICSYGTALVEQGISSKQLIKGLCWLEVAGNKGCARAFGYLSSIHEGGNFVSHDRILAIQYGVKAYYAGALSAAHGVAKMLYRHLEISDFMLGDAVNWCKISINQGSPCDAMWQLDAMEKRYGAERLNAAQCIIPQDFGTRKFEHYICQYGYPKFGLFE